MSFSVSFVRRFSSKIAPKAYPQCANVNQTSEKAFPNTLEEIVYQLYYQTKQRVKYLQSCFYLQAYCMSHNWIGAAALRMYSKSSGIY
ncbi:hypothetical protein NPIL_576911 [Nephila pilipes]|uniref:Uncharacterized protein n=1 Tax=Nephila pilipes TaxID=299642 RepID=A0A8X6NBT1_NEPPI|nr:hypothetical protein NPIL_576911 [Nephila pilipes]